MRAREISRAMKRYSCGSLPGPFTVPVSSSSRGFGCIGRDKTRQCTQVYQTMPNDRNETGTAGSARPGGDETGPTLLLIGSRHWTPENVVRNLPDTAIPPQLSEDKEQEELLEILLPLLESARDEVYALDLHSTSAEGVPFATVGDTLRNRAFAQKFPITVLLGIEEQLEGTLLEHLNNLGVVTLGFEGGQHYAESTIATHAALVKLALVHAGIAPGTEIPVGEAKATLGQATGQKRIVEVRYRQAIGEGDTFQMQP